MANPTMTLIGSPITVGTSVSSVTFGSGGTLPQTYTDLKLVCSTRVAGTGGGEYIAVSFNGSSSNFNFRQIYGTGATAGSSNSTFSVGGYTSDALDTANTFGNTEIYIPNYTSSNYKSFSADSAEETNGTGPLMNLVANLWSNTAAITSITLSSSSNFVQYSTFYLYGIKSS
jgi:hypothetical protein